MKSSNHITLVIADDHPLFRKGLRDAIEPQEQFSILAEAGDGESVLNAIQELRPQIAIIDIQMPKMTGLEVARTIHQENLTVSVIILTMFDDEDVFNKAMEYGVMGYILKESATLDIIYGISKVAQGEYYISPRLAIPSQRKEQSLTQLNQQNIGLSSLTPKEQRVLHLIAEKKSTREIAETLFISSRTVEHHRANICRKLNLGGSFSLLRFAIENQKNL